MNEDSMLKCLIALLLGFLFCKYMGNGFSVGCVDKRPKRRNKIKCPPKSDKPHKKVFPNKKNDCCKKNRVLCPKGSKHPGHCKNTMKECKESHIIPPPIDCASKGEKTCPSTGPKVCYKPDYICPGILPPDPNPPTPTCNVGEDVKCPGGVWCAGNQCCPDGSICPSADNAFNGCPDPKLSDCTKGEEPVVPDPDNTACCVDKSGGVGGCRAQSAMSGSTGLCCSGDESLFKSDYYFSHQVECQGQ